MKKKQKSITNMSAAEIREFMESLAKNGQARLDEEIEKIAHAAATEILSVFDVRIPSGTSHANRPQVTIEIIIAEQIKYKGHARDEMSAKRAR